MANIRIIFMIIVSSSTFVLQSCSSKVTTGSIPSQGLTVSQIYHQTMADDKLSGELSQTSVKKARKSVDYSGYTRTALNETKALAKTVNNPQIPIYVFPHMVQLGDEQLFKPGYTTAFFLYKKNQYALLSEKF